MTITLGNLRLVGERLDTMYTRVTLDDPPFRSSVIVPPSTWDALERVAAVVEAAQQVKAMDEIETGFGGGLRSDSPGLVERMAALYATLDTLTAGGEK